MVIELWKSDGTEAGTVMVKDIRSGYQWFHPYQSLTNVNCTLFFTANDGILLAKSYGKVTAQQREQFWLSIFPLGAFFSRLRQRRKLNKCEWNIILYC